MDTPELENLLVTGLVVPAVCSWPGSCMNVVTTTITSPYNYISLWFATVLPVNAKRVLYNKPQPVSSRIICPSEYQYCCNPYCCIINRQHKELWETWYFWCGVVIIFLFVMTSAFSYVIGSCKRKQQNLIRIRNISTPAGIPVISTVSGPGGIIQPKVNYKKPHSTAVQTTAIISNSDMNVEDFAGPLDPPYPAIQPVTIVRGSIPPQGFRQTTSYTELVLPPGYVDTDNYKRPH